MLKILKNFFEKNIKGTPYKAIVIDRKVYLCRLTNAVCDGIEITNNAGKVYVTSRALKHLFDKKPAEEFFFLIDNLYKIVKYPDKIYQNKTSKRGEYCLVKRVGDSDYLCSIEIVKSAAAVLGLTEFGISECGESNEIEEIQIATAFRLRDSDYIKKYTLLWSWEDGTPPS
ncbi:hypothetical protein COX74_01055 [bacterium (Candidatus Gribaldobacteria) CG_4_10_14_0_2_um_filter_41_16]|uniref:Uncharacterized protein n=4 Tax=Candidatus Gribaldobacteria TaxID=2798536 RepID=A0A2M7VIT4_9BACT|nr:MAG: hypothetical protein AUJ36_03320 [Parcubacteria group bacterium CG1_02_41_26]PIR91227.1 MAG: hypothetical protein COU03_02660 [bacterium (Candidatus Gribaldobacteria) CG10_big_fil_rev_8_21_14_0_10_41_12]PIV47326.1 MAG: hypothetical protein COS21_00545 [bacterium (Candidatus Gribaldobacteria) CG02_land_8_20_14_3_00_41_15]PJA01752.1 MAG: hypothetical protein COX74_01055 [bacterium (Candidatus Gribaldobacteria) CG_4_10_14_0_2_um_filter_41_16]